MDYNYSILNWDSQFFGYKVASLKPWKLESRRLKELIAEMKMNDITLAYFFVNPDDTVSINALLNISGFLADEKISFIANIKDVNNFVFSHNVKPYKLNYSTDNLKLLALQSGLFSRFKVDPNFINDEYVKLYIEWIEKSVKKIVAKEILVYYKDNIEKGFVTVEIKDMIGSIGLIAVDESERGNSIGKELVNAALSFFGEHKVDQVEVVTQMANKVACKFYQSLGFSIKSIENIYHIWIK
jgi:dTDP-4-amino-4,6-dideoxy-D-galactose acyltransferase